MQYSRKRYLLEEVVEQLLAELAVPGLGGSLHGVLVQLVLLGQRQGLAPPPAHLVDERRDAPELHQLVLLDLRGKKGGQSRHARMRM